MFKRAKIEVKAEQLLVNNFSLSRADKIIFDAFWKGSRKVISDGGNEFDLACYAVIVFCSQTYLFNDEFQKSSKAGMTASIVQGKLHEIFKNLDVLSKNGKLANLRNAIPKLRADIEEQFRSVYGEATMPEVTTDKAGAVTGPIPPLEVLLENVPTL